MNSGESPPSRFNDFCDVRRTTVGTLTNVGAETPLEISIKLLGSQLLRGLCSTTGPCHEPLRGQVQVVPDSVTNVVGKRRRIRDTKQVATKHATTG